MTNYDHASPSFVGRKEELEQLEIFAKDKNKFLWWWLIGEGGIGKSRLALEWVRRHRFRSDVGFWQGKSEDLVHWRPRRSTIIVVDDASEQMGQELVEILSEKARTFLHPVRLLLIERDRPVAFEEAEEVRTQRDYRYRASPLDLEELLTTDTNSLIEVSANRARKPKPQGEVLRQILEIGQNSPFWLLLALESYFDQGKLTWQNRQELLHERVETEQSKWKSIHGFPEEEEGDSVLSVLALATLTHGLPPEVLQEHDLALWEKGYKGKEHLYRRLFEETHYGGNIIPKLKHDLLGEYFVLYHIDALATGRARGVTVSELRRAALKIDLEKTTYTLAHLQINFPDYPASRFELLDPPPELAPEMPDLTPKEDVLTDLRGWLMIRAHLLGSPQAPDERKQEILQEILKRISYPGLDKDEQAQQAIAFALANSLMWLVSSFWRGGKEKNRAKLSDLIEYSQKTLSHVSEIHSAYPNNQHIANSYGHSLLACIWLVSNKTSSRHLLWRYFESLKSLAQSHPQALTAYAQALVAVVGAASGSSDEKQYLNTLKSLAGEDLSLRSAFAQGLLVAISQRKRSGDAQRHLNTLKSLASEDPPLRSAFAQGLVAAISQRTGDTERHLNTLNSLSRKDPSLRSVYARRLLVLITRGGEHPQQYLQALKDLAAQDSSLRHVYARGLTNAIYYRVGDTQQHLNTLQSMAREDFSLSAAYGRGLASAIYYQAGDTQQHLNRLQSMARKDPSLQSSYARGLANAIRERSRDARWYLNTLQDMAEEDPSLCAAYARGLANAIYYRVGDAQQHLDTLQSMAEGSSSLRHIYARGLVNAIRRKVGDDQQYLDGLRKLADQEESLKRYYQRGLSLAE